MTTLELYEIDAVKSRQTSISDSLKQFIAQVLKQRSRSRTLKLLETFDATRLADIGLEPDEVEDALNGDGARLWSKIDARNARR